MQSHAHTLARVRSLALAAMATAEGKPLHVAARSAPPAPPAPLPRSSPPRPAGVAGDGLSPSERRRLSHLSPAAIAAVDRVVAKLGRDTTRHGTEPPVGKKVEHFRRSQKTLPAGWE